MTIREVLDAPLLQQAAKAAGYKLHRRVNDVHHFEQLLLKDNSKHWSQWPEWNPLLNDGDRHRLQVDLKLTVTFEPSRREWIIGADVNNVFQWLVSDAREPYAIVRAAAEIAKQQLR